MAEKGRQTIVYLNYEKKDVSRLLRPFMEELTYTDVATGGSDEVSVTLDNRDMRFLGKWKPLKGAALKVKVKIQNWVEEKQNLHVTFGTFVTDDLSAGGPPGRFTLKAVSAPVKGGFRATPRTHTYKNATVQSIAKTIADRAGVKLFYDAGKINVKEKEQSKEPDSSFLLGLCEEYGLGLKIYNNKIVIFDEEQYEKRREVYVIKRRNKHVISWEWNTTLQGNYTGVRVTYTNPGDNKKHKAMAGRKGRILEANISAFGKRDAELKAKALLRKQNKERTTMTITAYPMAWLCATRTVRLTGFGKASGKYYIERITNTISGTDGYEQVLELRKVGTA